LQKMGVGPEVLVGISTDRSSDMLVGILGILKAGGAYVPLDPAYPRERLTAILEDAQASILLTQQSLLELLPQSSAQVVSLDSDWWKIELESADAVASRVKPENLAYVLFTSGSTGRPKGVALEHRSASAFIQWAQTVFSRQDVAGTLFSTSMCFDLSVFEMFVPLSMGGKGRAGDHRATDCEHSGLHPRSQPSASAHRGGGRVVPGGRGSGARVFWPARPHRRAVRPQFF